ncbi:hypothetical protein D047_0097B, partial [Vibrio parahaemolyticus VPTS-2010_2]
CAV